MDVTFHYPPELLDLLVDTIPLLCRSKHGVVTFLRGAGVNETLFRDLEDRVRTDPSGISKYEIARTVLVRLNQRGEVALRDRREILKRVTQFDSFASCWPKDQLTAKGLVSEIRQLVNVKDSFTRMSVEREREAENRRADHEARLDTLKRKRSELQLIRADMVSLFSLKDPQKRGKLLEGVLNRLFKAAGIGVREAFTLSGDHGEGIIEQIDGVVELDGSLYLVEIKWWNRALGPGEVAQHLVRVFNRGHARGIFVSASNFTDAAIEMCRESLSKATVVLCQMEEFIRLLETEEDLSSMLRTKVRAAVIDKNPYYRA